MEQHERDSEYQFASLLPGFTIPYILFERLEQQYSKNKKIKLGEKISLYEQSLETQIQKTRLRRKKMSQMTK